MKSRDIAKKFVTEFVAAKDSEEAMKECVRDLIFTFHNDFTELSKSRNIGSESGVFNLISEMNQKWNAVRARLYQHFGEHVLIHDGWIDYMRHTNPNLYSIYIIRKAIKNQKSKV